MRRFLLSALAVVLASLGIFSPLYAQGDQPVTIRGFIINRTTGEKAPAGLEVTLEVRLRGETVETRTTALGETGEFEFTDVPGGDGYQYLIRTRYRNITYEWMALPELPGQFPIYETTSSPEALRVEGITLVLVAAQPREGLLRFVGLVSVVNTGDRAYIPDPSQGLASILRFGLPQGYRDLDVGLQRVVDQGPVRVDLPDGFALLVSIPPEEPVEVVYTFRIPYQGGRVSLTQPFPFATDRFLVLVPEEVQVDGAGLLQDRGVQDINGTPFRLYTGQGFQAGDQATLLFANLPTYGVVDRLRSALDTRAVRVGVPAGLVGLVGLGFLVYALLRRRAPAPAPAGEAPPFPAHGELPPPLDPSLQAGEEGAAHPQEDRSAGSEAPEVPPEGPEGKGPGPGGAGPG